MLHVPFVPSGLVQRGSIAILLCAVTSVALTLLWVRSHFVADTLNYHYPSTTRNFSWHVNSASGLFIFGFVRQRYDPPLSRQPDGRIWAWFRYAPSPFSRASLPGATYLQDIGYDFGLDFASSGPQLYVRTRYGLPVFLTGPPLAIHVIRASRAKRRPPHLCPNCGYDLRASTGRCPECGLAAPGSGKVPQPAASEKVVSKGPG
jgi:hypothetical protein